MSIPMPMRDQTAAAPAARDNAHSQGIWSNLGTLLRSSDPLRLLVQLARYHAGCIRIRMRSRRVLLLTEIDQFKHVLVTNSQNYSKYMEGIETIFGHSMITKDGEHWQKLRAVEQPAFHPSMISSYVPDFLTAINYRMERWKTIARTGRTIDICEETWALAAQMTCMALFDRDLPFDPGVVFSAVKAFTKLSNHEVARLRIENGELVETEESAIGKAAKTWLSLPRLILDADARDRRGYTLLRMMQRATSDPAIPEFDQQQVLDEVKQYIWAGTETTAITLAWALYLTARHPEVAERVRREAAEIYGDREQQSADYLKLSYTRQVIQETMRIYPPIWSLARTAEAADKIGDCDVEAGDTIVLCTYVAHHDPRYWAEPERFEPERFNAERAKGRAPYSYLPFGGGRRACIGGAMSQVENVLALSLLLRDFELEYVGADPVAVNPTVTLAPRDGLPFWIRCRAQKATTDCSTPSEGSRTNRKQPGSYH
jgi:cytochrome P450